MPCRALEFHAGRAGRHARITSYFLATNQDRSILSSYGTKFLADRPGGIVSTPRRRSKELAVATRDLATRKREKRRLFEQAGDRLKKSIPKNTLDAYKRDWGSFEAWCQEWGQSSMPASDATLVLYLTWMADQGYKPRTIERAVSGICFAHRQDKKRNPDGKTPKSPELKLHLRAIKRDLGMELAQAAPILAEDLTTIMRVMHKTEVLSMRDIRDKAALLVGWFGCLRRSEIAGLQRRDVVFGRDGLVVKLRSGKTQKDGAVVEVAVVPAENKLVCPVRALRELVDSHDEEHVFSKSMKEAILIDVAMPANQMRAIVLRWVKRAKLPEPPAGQSYSPHSLRAGSITSAAMRDLPDWRIMEHSRHKTFSVYAKYIRNARKFKGHPLAGIL